MLALLGSHVVLALRRALGRCTGRRCFDCRLRDIGQRVETSNGRRNWSKGATNLAGKRLLLTLPISNLAHSSRVRSVACDLGLRLGGLNRALLRPYPHLFRFIPFHFNRIWLAFCFMTAHRDSASRPEPARGPTSGTDADVPLPLLNRSGLPPLSSRCCPSMSLSRTSTNGSVHGPCAEVQGPCGSTADGRSASFPAWAPGESALGALGSACGEWSRLRFV